MKSASHLTLEEQVGQLFFVGFQGTELTEYTTDIFKKIQPGGVIFSQRNLTSLDQTYKLNLKLQQSTKIPFFLGINQEGGLVDRFKHLIAPIPSAAALADVGVSTLRVGTRIIASEIQGAGFNTNLGPVLDLGLPNSFLRERTLGASGSEVVRYGRVVLEEYAKKNILTCARHFPGLGGANRDPHFVLPRIERSRRELLVEDVVPFEALSTNVDMLMVSHAHYPALGDIRPVPASLSVRIVEGLLRKTLGFKGIVITDDLTMGAITSVGLKGPLFLRALEAGNDMLLFSQTTPLLEEAFSFIVAAARADKNLRLRIAASVDQILTLKQTIELAPLRHQPQMKSRLTRQIDKLKRSIASVEQIRMR